MFIVAVVDIRQACKAVANASRTLRLPSKREPQGLFPLGISRIQSSEKNAMMRSRSCALKASHSSVSVDRMSIRPLHPRIIAIRSRVDIGAEAVKASKRSADKRAFPASTDHAFSNHRCSTPSSNVDVVASDRPSRRLLHRVRTDRRAGLPASHRSDRPAARDQIGGRPTGSDNDGGCRAALRVLITA